jgi:hypothetical protein
MTHTNTTRRATTKGARFPGRPVKGPNITDDLAALRFCSAGSAKKSLERWRETCTDLAVIARRCPIAHLLDGAPC